MSSKVLVTGATGFVAKHIIAQLLDKGFTVVGTARSQSKADAVLAQYKRKFSDPKLEFVVVDDFLKADGFVKVLNDYNDIKYVLHTASPVTETESDQDYETFFKKPAVEGTLNVLRSVKDFGPQVEKVVVTSSIVASFHLDKLEDPSFKFDEFTWSPIEWDVEFFGKEWLLAYQASKKLAEKAAWEFYETENSKFELTVVNPPFVFGPQFFDEDAGVEKLNTSSQFVKNFLDTDPNDIHLFDEFKGIQADVRDIAAFHILPLEREGLSGKRLLPVGSRFTGQGILNIINEEFPELQGSIAKGDPTGEKGIITVGYDDSKTLEWVGGYDYIPFNKVVYDSIKQILDQRK